MLVEPLPGSFWLRVVIAQRTSFFVRTGLPEHLRTTQTAFALYSSLKAVDYPLARPEIGGCGRGRSPEVTVKTILSTVSLPSASYGIIDNIIRFVKAMRLEDIMAETMVR